jgi:hypothetical protein
MWRVIREKFQGVILDTLYDRLMKTQERLKSKTGAGAWALEIGFVVS